MSAPRSSPYIWVTWIIGMLSGDTHCEWATWFKAHFSGYTKLPKQVDLATWKAEHGEIVRRRAEELRAQGYTVYVEDQNKFTLKGSVATVAGTPDIVAILENHDVPDGERSEFDYLVVDCKSGQPRDKDYFQVLIYMLALPLMHRACRGKAMRGELEYRETRVVIEPEKLTDTVKALIRRTVERVAQVDPLPIVPSVSECRFCDIAECQERMQAEAATAEVEHNLW